MNEPKNYLNRLVRRLLVAALLTILLLVEVVPAVEAAPAPPPKGGGRPGQPSAGCGFREMDNIFSPAIGTPGEEITYTLHVVCEPVLSNWGAFDTNIELPMFSTQKFVRFNPLNTGWTKRDTTDNTIWIDIGTMHPKDQGTIQLVLTVPTDLNRPIMEQGLYMNWNDEGGVKHKGNSLLLPLKVPLPGPIELPPVPSGQSPRGLPTSGPFAAQPNPPVSQQNTVTSWYIAATSHNVSGDFLTYWLEHGAVLVLGYPISEIFQEPGSGLVIQYFERGILEAHPENNDPYQVLIKSLGRELDKAKPAVSTDDTPAPSPGSVFYAETGHWLDGRFVDYWQKNGGLEQFGFPIAEPQIVGNRLIQWTERARFEVDVNSRFTPLVQLGLVGVEFAKSKGYLPN